MDINVGKLDKILRLILIVMFAIFGIVYSKWFFVPAIILAFTVVTGWCGLYTLLKINTCTDEEHQTLKSKNTKKFSKKKK